MPWRSRILFLLTMAMAALLAGLVAVAPVLAIEDPLLELLAQDQVVRRTALASGVGLLVTALVFFLPRGRKSKPPKLPPGGFAGA